MPTRQRNEIGSSHGSVIDAGARARMQAKAAQVAAGVYRFWNQGITVDVTYADGRVELDNTLYGIIDDCRLRDGGRYLKTLEDQPGRSYLSVVSGDTYVRLVLQPSPDRMVRTFNMGQPTDWIGSIVLVPRSEKKLIGLARLRSDIPPDHNKKLLERAKRLFVQHSGGVEVRDMADEEVAEYRGMLPPVSASSAIQLMPECNAVGQGEDVSSDALYRDDEIVVRPNDVTTSQGVFALSGATPYEVRGRTRTAIALLLVASLLVPFTHLSDLGRTIGSPTWVAPVAGMFAVASFAALFAGLAAPATILLKRPLHDRDVAIYSSRNRSKVRAVAKSLAQAAAARHARARREREARREAGQAARAAEQAALAAARTEEERQYEALLQTAAAKEPMPFQVWASTQSDGHLLTSTAEYLAVRLDDAYGAPGIVDRFFERGLQHIVNDDIASTKQRVRQWISVQGIVRHRAEARRDSNSHWRREVIDALVRSADLAAQLGLTRLARQYRQMIGDFIE